MELLAVGVMIVIGGIAAIFVMFAIAIAKGEREQRSNNRDELAASILFQVLIAGGATPDDAIRTIRREGGLGAKITQRVDVSSWAGAFAQSSSPEARERLLETAVQIAAARHKPIPHRQYAALLDLSFGLGFHSDALARLRDRYLDPRAEWLRVLEIEGTPTRATVTAAYRRLAAQHHPDRFHDQSEEVQRAEAARFIEITNAYEHLLGSGL